MTDKDRETIRIIQSESEYMKLLDYEYRIIRVQDLNWLIEKIEELEALSREKEFEVFDHFETPKSKKTFEI